MNIVIKYAMEKMNVSFVDGNIFRNKGLIEEGPETEDPLKPHYSKIRGMLMQYLFASITLMQLIPTPIPRSHTNLNTKLLPRIPTAKYAQPSDNIFTDKSVSIFLLNVISFSNSPANNVNQEFMWFLSELLMHPELIEHPLYREKYEIHRNNIERYGEIFKHYIFWNENYKQIARWIQIVPQFYRQKELHALARK
jgi:hypothetical protein